MYSSCVEGVVAGQGCRIREAGNLDTLQGKMPAGRLQAYGGQDTMSLQERACELPGVPAVQAVEAE